MKKENIFYLNNLSYPFVRNFCSIHWVEDNMMPKETNSPKIENNDVGKLQFDMLSNYDWTTGFQ